MPFPETGSLQVRPVGAKGRGVFALVRFAAGQLIEAAPVIPVPAGDMAALNRTALADYPYDWRDGEALIMGFGSFYNHSYEPNAYYVRRFEDLTLDYIALRDIAVGEEITVNYNGTAKDRSPLWFNVEEKK